MTTPNRIARLKDLIALEEKRGQLLEQVSTVDARIAVIQNELYGKASTPAKAVAVAAPVKAKGKAARKGRGQLREQILSVLQGAGAAGASVKELAKAAGVKPGNIYTWFNGNLKKVAGLVKVSPGQFAFAAAAPKAEAPAKKGKTVKKVKAKPTKAVKASKAPEQPKAAKPAKPAKKAKAVKKGKAVKAKPAAPAPIVEAKAPEVAA